MNEATEISSLQNTRVKNIVKLRQRSHREASGLMIIEGQKEILKALKNDVKPSEVYICREKLSGEDADIISQLDAMGIETFECTVPVFEKLAYRDNPQGILVVAPAISINLKSFQPPDNPLIVIAEAIEKPGNLGSILRSADAAGANAVIVCDRCTDINNPNVIRSSIGTIFCLPVIDASTEETLAWLKENNIQTLSATPDGTVNYTDVDMKQPTAIVVGAEHEGLSDTWLNHTDQQVFIPMMGQADSLNVSAATTILMYEALRQRNPRTTLP